MLEFCWENKEVNIISRKTNKSLSANTLGYELDTK